MWIRLLLSPSRKIRRKLIIITALACFHSINKSSCSALEMNNLTEPLLYSIIISQQSLDRIKTYKNTLISKYEPGKYLDNQIQRKFRNEVSRKGSKNVPDLLKKIKSEQFIDLLLSTKLPTIFAESEIRGNGTDWNEEELKILGDINVAMSVTVYDNGVWSLYDKSFKIHSPPLKAELLFTPGPLLRKGRDFKGNTPDYKEIVVQGQIDQSKYNELIERRLAPVFTYANENAKRMGTKAVITLPGIGCGAFAGSFKGEVGEHLNQAVQNVLNKNGDSYTHILCVYYDPFNECRNEDKTIHNIKYRVRPALKNPGRGLLSDPRLYQEPGEDFSNSKLYKIVAWDHVSLPGNDFFIGSRHTDDGVSAAATNSMEVLTCVKGQYNKMGSYTPPAEFKNWFQVTNQKIFLRAYKNVMIAAGKGYTHLLKLDEIEDNTTENVGTGPTLSEDEKSDGLISNSDTGSSSLNNFSEDNLNSIKTSDDEKIDADSSTVEESKCENQDTGESENYSESVNMDHCPSTTQIDDNNENPISKM